MPSVIYEIAGILAFMLALVLFQVAASRQRLCPARTRVHYFRACAESQRSQQPCASAVGTRYNPRRSLQ
ncbi:hypothetical protein [Pseudomonas aeruginosa]|uniref:hypothetical protein n=1 Tax=Pseudomonas aeruginosa TaxID=287 RepID=UPI0013CE097D|nr:hypothetical protein [Pseudomonas aeruginosa]